MPSCSKPARAPLQAAQGPHDLHSAARGCSQLPGAAVSAEAPEGSRRSLTAVAIGHRSDRPGALGCARPSPLHREVRGTGPEGVGRGAHHPLEGLKHSDFTHCTVLL